MKRSKLFPKGDISMFKPENLRMLRAEFEATAYANPPDSDIREIYIDAVKELDSILNKIENGI